MPPGSVERQMYHSFWNKYSDRADNTSMLLNANADELAELDRAEIIGMLPEFSGKFVVDIGAGIGRFTSEFAKTASRVVSTDFMANFIQKNREENAHFGNIEWHVGDALGLELPASSVDLVFTNWLLMYLSDAESIQFMANVLRWLRPGGHLHLRESCSEPSTGKNTNGASLHSQNEVNPTRYRFSSAYINLLEAIRFRDNSSGELWRFRIHWACSVGVYIEKNSNWRQVHWLVSKMRADEKEEGGEGGGIMSEEKLSQMLTNEWPSQQRNWDSQLDAKIGRNELFTEKLLVPLNGKGIGPDSLVFMFNGRQSEWQYGIDGHTLAKHFGCHVWSVENSPFCYRHSLTMANNKKDHRVRMAWHPNLASSLAFWTERHERVKFNAFLTINLFDNIGKGEDAEEILAKIADVLNDDGILVNVQTSPNEMDQKKIKNLLNAKFRIVENMANLNVEEGGDNLSLVVATKKLEKRGEDQLGMEWPEMPPINAGF